jgi:hypothetical protein
MKARTFDSTFRIPEEADTTIAAGAACPRSNIGGSAREWQDEAEVQRRWKMRGANT